MTNNPVPASKTTRRPAVQTVKKVPVKRDINLISNKEAQEKVARRGLFVIAAVVFLLGFAYFAFYLPLMSGKVLEATLQNINQQAEAYATADAQFMELSGQVKSLAVMSESLKNTSNSNKSGYDYMKMVESASPGTVRLTNFELNPTGITLSGIAASDNDVAQLVVNLQSYSNFTNVTVTSVSQAVAAPNDPSAATPQTAKVVGRGFVIVADFPAAAADTTAAPTVAPTATPAGNGGSGT